MANFNTHLAVACIASGIASVSLYNKQLIELFDIPWFLFLGTVGGLLPDVDSNTSKPLKILFNSLAILAAILVFYFYQDSYKIQFLFLFSIAAFLLVRFPLLFIFKRLTVHRGVFHSLLAAVFFTFLSVYISHTFFKSSIQFAWLSGLFIGFGFIVHLLLDELYSVELGNVQLKRSFGSAFKLFSLQYLHASFIMLLACTLLYFYTPTMPFQQPKALEKFNIVLAEGRSSLEHYFYKIDW